MARTAAPPRDRAAPRPAGRGGQAHRHHAEIDRLERLADLMDSRFSIPGTGIRFGLDSLIGLIPGLGDGAALLPAAYLVWRAHQLGAPKHVLARMAGNLGIDLVVGAIPLVGDLFDLGFKANRRNIALLRRHLGPPTIDVA